MGRNCCGTELCGEGEEEHQWRPKIICALLHEVAVNEQHSLEPYHAKPPSLFVATVTAWLAWNEDVGLEE